MVENNRRSYDAAIAELLERVEELDSEIRDLRNDFSNHVTTEELKIETLNTTLLSIQVKLDQLILDMKEPLDVYKSAKAGMTFMKFVTETAKWLGPLIVGIYLGTSGLPDNKTTSTKPNTEITK